MQIWPRQRWNTSTTRPSVIALEQSHGASTHLFPRLHSKCQPTWSLWTINLHSSHPRWTQGILIWSQNERNIFRSPLQSCLKIRMSNQQRRHQRVTRSTRWIANARRPQKSKPREWQVNPLVPRASIPMSSSFQCISQSHSSMREARQNRQSSFSCRNSVSQWVAKWPRRTPSSKSQIEIQIQ